MKQIQQNICLKMYIIMVFIEFNNLVSFGVHEIVSAQVQSRISPKAIDWS